MQMDPSSGWFADGSGPRNTDQDWYMLKSEVTELNSGGLLSPLGSWIWSQFVVHCLFSLFCELNRI